MNSGLNPGGKPRGKPRCKPSGDPVVPRLQHKCCFGSWFGPGSEGKLVETLFAFEHAGSFGYGDEPMGSRFRVLLFADACQHLSVDSFSKILARAHNGPPRMLRSGSPASQRIVLARDASSRSDPGVGCRCRRHPTPITFGFSANGA